MTHLEVVALEECHPGYLEDFNLVDFYLRKLLQIASFLGAVTLADRRFDSLFINFFEDCVGTLKKIALAIHPQPITFFEYCERLND